MCYFVNERYVNLRVLQQLIAVAAGAPSMFSPQQNAAAWNDPPVVRDAAKVFRYLHVYFVF